MIRLIYYFIKNKIKPIELPKYQWYDNIVTFSNIRNNDNHAHIKFYATKNWVEIYIEDSADVDFLDSAVNSQNYKKESLIVPKWKIVSYKPHFQGGYVLEIIGVSWKDYKRYKDWQNKK